MKQKVRGLGTSGGCWFASRVESYLGLVSLGALPYCSSMTEISSNLVHWPPILCYHAIAQVTDDPHNICVSPEQFEAQMLYLKRRNLRGVPVRKLLDAMNKGKARGLVGLTFDDAYENFSHNALPVLERLNFSCTVFVCSGM